jgi:hypothetical protein
VKRKMLVMRLAVISAGVVQAEWPAAGQDSGKDRSLSELTLLGGLAMSDARNPKLGSAGSAILIVFCIGLLGLSIYYEKTRKQPPAWAAAHETCFDRFHGLNIGGHVRPELEQLESGWKVTAMFQYPGQGFDAFPENAFHCWYESGVISKTEIVPGESTPAHLIVDPGASHE